MRTFHRYEQYNTITTWKMTGKKKKMFSKYIKSKNNNNNNNKPHVYIGVQGHYRPKMHSGVKI